jgi:HAD superfamily hydrolase (TIGR01509 family)
MIQAVIFDMDGVLFDTERIAVRSWEESGRELGISGLGKCVPSCLGLRPEPAKKIVLQVVGEDFPYEKFRQRVREHSYAYFDQYGVPVKDGVRIALQYLKDNGYKTAVATSTSKKSATHHFTETGLTEYFDAFVFGDEITVGKPAPDIYLAAAKKLDVVPECCLAIEDSPNGILSAAAAGMQPVMVPDLVQPDEALRQHIAYQLSNLSQLGQLLSQLA